MQTGRPTRRKRTEFGQRLAAAREQAGLSQAQLAERLGTTQRAISWWEREPVALRTEQLTALADALGVSMDFLLGKQPLKARGSGPVGKARRLFDAISKLPRHQQEKIFAILEPFIAQHSNGKAA
jgi:transcriptional regulator with XRE-family HTH domain